MPQQLALFPLNPSGVREVTQPISKKGSAGATIHVLFSGQLHESNSWLF